MKQEEENEYRIIFPSSGKGKKELDVLYLRRRTQTIRAIHRLKNSPTDFRLKGIEKISDTRLGQYTIRVSKGDRIFYDVDRNNKTVYVLRAGKHDLYKLI